MDSDLKSAQRKQALQARGQGGDDAAMTRNLRQVMADYRGQVLAGYWPMRDEADPRPAMAAHDGPVVLPVVMGKARPLVFRRWQGDALVHGAFGTAHPPESAPVMQPQVLIVPLVGFDRHGSRLGYGGGFYDRTLSDLRRAGQVTAIGLAWGAQELPLIPVEPTDEPLDVIVTDRGVIAI